MSDVFLITGSSNGVGFECAKALARFRKGRIILACRNVELANQRKAELCNIEMYDESKVIVLPEPLDLSEIDSVRTYATSLKKYLTTSNLRIKCLINNAGIGGNVLFKKNSLDYDLIWATNHLGHFLLTLLILPFIDERIINVSSEVHDPSGEHNLPDPENGWPSLSATSAEEYDNVICKGLATEGDNEYKACIRRYTRSKLCNVYFTHELARRLSNAIPKFIEREEVKAAYESLPKVSCTLSKAKEIKVVAFNPGLMLDTMFVTNSINSAWLANTLWFLSPGIKNLLPVGNLMRDSRTSGERMAKLAFGAIESDATAAFFSDEKSKPSSRFSRSIEGIKHQVELWNNSIRWAKITDDELIQAGLKIPTSTTTPSKISETPTLIGLVGALPSALGI